MLLLASTSSKIQLVTGSAAAVKPHASWSDNNAGAISYGETNTASIASATTTDIVAAPASSVTRNVRFLSARNDHASASTDVTIQHVNGTATIPLWKGTLLAGESVNFNEGAGWQYLDATGALKAPTTKLDTFVRVTGDVTNATTSFADITGLTVPIKGGKNYVFEAFLQFSTDATTTGAQFGVNGPTLTALRAAALQGVGASVTAAAMSNGSITAYDTAIIAQTTGPGTTVIGGYLSGQIICSADGTFTMRSKSEVAVAGGLVIKAGSWLHVRECDN
jgi:hypothetical protein